MKKDNGISSCVTLYQNSSTPSTKPLILKRQYVVFFCFSACFIMFFLRYNLSVAVVAIKEEQIKCPDNLIFVFDNRTYKDSLTSLILNDSDVRDDSVTCYQNKYNYDEIIISQFLAAYFYGYTLFQIPTARLSEKYGIAKDLIGYGTLCSGFLSLITPWMLDIGYFALIICRFLIGSLHACILSCSYCLFADWLPKEKNGNAITWINVGYELGGIISFYLTGVICNIDYLGWRYSFYLFSISSFIWFVPYYFLVYSRPENDPYLSDYEKNLIKMERKANFFQQENDTPSKIIKVPPKLKIKTLLTSGPVIASCFAKFSYALGYYIIATKIPNYLKELFDLPINENGLYSAFPLFGIFLSKMMCLKLSSLIINLNVMSLTNVRKLFQSISLFTPAICLLILTFKNDNQDVDIFLIFLAMLGAGFCCGGDSSITAEFGGELSGTIFGFTNVFGCANGFLAPILTGAILENTEDKFFGWNIIFYIAIGFYIIGGIIFLIFASAKTQEWCKPKFIAVNDKDNLPA